MKRWSIIAALLCLLCSSLQAKENTMQITDIHRAITSQQGWLNTSRPLTAEDLEGRIILLDFWTFCCINCQHVMPDLAYLEHKFGDKLTVIGVHSAKFANERDTENIKNAILRHDLRHPVVNDFDFSIWRRFGVRAWPTLILINPDGHIDQVYSGEGNREAIEADVSALLSKYAGQVRTEPLPISLEKSKTPEMVLKFPGKIIAGMLEDKPVLFVSDSGHHRIVAISPQGEVMLSIGSGIAGLKDGDFNNAAFNTPQGLAYKDGTLYVADTANHALRRVDLADGKVTTIAGTGEQGYERGARNAPALKTPMASPWDVAFYPDDNHLIIALAGTHQLWSYDIAKKTVSAVAGNGRESIDDGAFPFNSLSQPSGLSALNGKLYFVDSETSSLRVFDGKSIDTLIGTGLFDFGYKEGKQGTALMQHAIGVFAHVSGVYVADSYNHSIRRYDEKEKFLHNFAGHGERGKKDGALAEASFNEPNGLVRAGDVLYVTDTNNQAIRTIDMKTGKVATLSVKESKQTASVFTFADILPNLAPQKPTSVKAGADIAVQFTLQPGWHVNEDAPSYMALFEMQGKTPVLVKGFTKDAVRAHKLSLPPLIKGKTYRLQSSIYYCEDKAGSQCLVKSFDTTISAGSEGESKLVYTLN